MTTQAATTRRKVLNYLARSVDLDELEEIRKAAWVRHREVRDARRREDLLRRLATLAGAVSIVRDPTVHTLTLGGRDPLAAASRWYVRGRHNGRKHVGLWVTRTPDEPRGPKSSVWLDLEDAVQWIPEPESPVGAGSRST
jgi:hypothetical protein